MNGFSGFARFNKKAGRYGVEKINRVMDHRAPNIEGYRFQVFSPIP